jgi:hypothetical protein
MGNGWGVRVQNLPTSGYIPSGGITPNIVGPGNVISGNVNSGVCLCDASNTTIVGNRIGTDVAGQTAVANGLHGIEVHGDDNVIGGTTAAARNLISGNSTDGILMSPHDLAAANRNVIQGNYIGLNAGGNSAIANGSAGVQLQNNEGAVVGGDTAGARNVISGNANSGILVSGDLGGMEIAGNYIGTAASGESAVGNVFFGIQANGPLAQANINNNVISGNGNLGVALGALTQDVSIMENRIGVTPSGSALGNANHGVFIRDSSGHDVGSPGFGANIIANNGGNGVMVTTDGGVAIGNTIRGNSIHSNNLKGIETASGGNNELPPPVINPPAGGTEITGTACANCTVDIYSDNVDEGRVHEGSTVANGAGAWTFNELVTGPFTTATATDAGGNTSEFSTPVNSPEPPTPTPSPTPAPTATPTPTPSPTAAPTSTPTATNGETPTPTPTAAPGDLTWGDHNCSGGADPIDSLLTLRHDADLGADTGACPDFGTALPASGPPLVWGDIDCGGGINAIDALKLLRFDAGLSVEQEEGCPQIGEEVTLTQ